MCHEGLSTGRARSVALWRPLPTATPLLTLRSWESSLAGTNDPFRHVSTRGYWICTTPVFTRINRLYGQEPHERFQAASGSQFNSSRCNACCP